MPFSPCGVLRRTGSWQRQHLHSQLPNSPLSSVLLLMRRRSTEADHPLLLCKWHNCRRDCKSVFQIPPSNFYSLLHVLCFSFFPALFLPLFISVFLLFHPSPSHLFPLSRATLFTLHLNFPSKHHGRDRHIRVETCCVHLRRCVIKPLLKPRHK